MQPASESDGTEGTASTWPARLELGFAHRRGRTVLARSAHEGPLRVQRPFYPEGDEQTCHVYLLHPPGGIVGGDQLRVDIEVAEGAHALITTPAAGKFYRTDGRVGVLAQRLDVSEGATLEWMPLSNIFYSGTSAQLITEVDLAKGAGLVLWDIAVLGRPAAQERFQTGSATQLLTVHREGNLLFRERAHFEGGHNMLSEPYGLAGKPVVGTLIVAPKPEHAITAGDLDELAAGLGELAGSTKRGELVIIRVLGDEAELVRQELERAWHVLRPLALGVDAVSPRIWAC